MNETASDYYCYDDEITNSGEHDFFTAGLVALRLQIRDFTMFYYGIDIDTSCTKITKFICDVESDALMLDKAEIQSTELYNPFAKCIGKEALYLKYSRGVQE